jgi:hypothetical protein
MEVRAFLTGVPEGIDALRGWNLTFLTWHAYAYHATMTQYFGRPFLVFFIWKFNSAGIAHRITKLNKG